MTQTRRIVSGTLFVLGLTICGLVAGTWIGGNFFVAKGSGLAGPAIAFGYGLLGALAAAIVGVLLAIYLSPKRLLVVALPVTVVALVFLVMLGIVVKRSRAETARHLQQAYEKLNAFELTLTYESSGDVGPFRSIEVDGDDRAYSAVTADGRTCSAALSGPERVAILTALRDVEVVLARDDRPCGARVGEIERTMAFRIVEARPPDSEGELAITAACLDAHAELARPFDVVGEIFSDGDHERACR